jgi:hypothetical protein
MNAMFGPAFMTVAAAVVVLAAWTPAAWSDPGDIVIVRKVEPRTAFRPGSGQVSASANPGQQVQNGIGVNRYPGGSVGHELSNSEFANVASGVPLRSGAVAARNAGIAGAQGHAAASAGSGITGGAMMTGTLGSSAGGTAGGMARQATGQVMDALKGVGLIGR